MLAIRDKAVCNDMLDFDKYSGMRIFRISGNFIISEAII